MKKKYTESGELLNGINPNRLELIAFLHSIDQLFPIPLSHKVSIDEYADKLLKYATLVSCYSNGSLVGLAAGYTKNLPAEGLAYLSIVGVSESRQKKGLGKALVEKFVAIAKDSGVNGVHLYTDPSNYKAIAMYRHLGFCRVFCDKDPRKNDVHFQLLFKE